MKHAAAALSLLALAACKKTPQADQAPVDSGDQAARLAPTTLAPARCKAIKETSVVGDDMEIGDAVASGDGYAVGVVRRTPAGRMAAVATSATVVDLWPTFGDAPPPRVAVRGGHDLVAAAYERDDGILAVAVVGGKPIASIPQHRDDSLAFDMAFAGDDGVVVWDEATGGNAPHGVIRVATMTGVARDASPADSDAEMPRVVPRDGSFVVLWIAHREERGARAGDSSVVSGQGLRNDDGMEATGEPRSFGWIEMAALDAHGVAAPVARKVTAPSGHVSAFDVGVLADKSILVVARDDGEAVDGSGGALLRIRVAGDKGMTVDPPLALATDGLGRGAPAVVLPWLAWVGPREESRLLAFDSAGVPAALPSREPLLDDARPLLLLGGSRLLAGAPSELSALFRVLSCIP